MSDWSYLSPAEFEKISRVLKRDRDLRLLEEARIKQLKQELICLRKRATLRPGLDIQRNCARCLTELGRIINRGALCPSCKKKVCKDCRHYGDENHEWLCIYCHKQMQLKAISGEWMQEFSKLSVRKYAKDPPGDELRKVLHESQRKGLFDPDVEHKKSQYAAETTPEKPLRTFQYELPCADDVKDSQIEINEFSAKTLTTIEVEKTEIDYANISPKVLPRVSPWNGIEPEPKIPLRVDQSRSFGSVKQYLENYPNRERQFSDGSHVTIGYRSRSTSSEVMDESENIKPVPLPRKRLNPLKKQQAIPEPSATESQQSSVDSGVFSPGLKLENSIDSTAPLSPLAVNRLSEQESVEIPVNHPITQCSAKESSSSENEEDCSQLNTKSPDKLFRKVTLKKRKYASNPKTMREKRSATLSTDARPIAPSSGLKCPFSNKKSCIPFNSNNKSNSKYKLTRLQTNVLTNSKIKPTASSSLIPKLKSKEMLKFSNSPCKHVGISLGSTLSNPEALCDGRIKNLADKSRKDVRSSPTQVKISPMQECQIPRGKDLQQSKELMHRIPEPKEKYCFHEKNNMNEVPTKKATQSKLPLNSNFSKRSKKRFSKRNDTHPSSTTKVNNNSITPVSLKIDKSWKKDAILQSHREYPNRLFRSASLPNRKTFVHDWLQSWLWKCHSLEDWLWYMDVQPYETRNFRQITILPDDYKLVYVSSSSTSSDSEESSSKSFNILMSQKSHQNFNLSIKGHLKVHSRIKMNCGTSYVEDSDWELESNDGDDFDFTFTSCKSKDLIQVNEANNFFVHNNLHTDVKWDHKQKQHCFSKVKKSRCRSPVSAFAHDFWFQERLLTNLKLTKPVVLKPFSHTTYIPSFPNKSTFFSSQKLNFQLTQFIREITTSPVIESDIKTGTAVIINSRCNFHLATYIDSCIPKLFRLDDKSELKSNDTIYIPAKDFVTYFLHSVNFLIPVQNNALTKLIQFVSDDKMSLETCNNLEFFDLLNVYVSLPGVCDLSRLFSELQRAFETYLFQRNALVFQRKNVLKRILGGEEKNVIIAFFDDYSEVNPPFKCNAQNVTDKDASLSYSLYFNGLLLSFDKFIDSSDAVTFHSLESFIIFIETSMKNKRSAFSKRRKCSKKHLKSLIFATHGERNVLKSHVIFPENKSGLEAGRCGSKIYFHPQYKFRNPTWRCEKVGNPLYPGDAASPPELTNRSRNKKSLAITGWGQERCCIARRRVIDLLGPLCGREVVADLTALLGCVAITGVSSSAKHGGRIVNAFFYHAPPAALKPEADYLLRKTRSDPRLLFQLRTLLESGATARMLTIKAETVAAAGVKTDYVGKVSLEKLGTRVGAMQIEKNELSFETVSRYGELSPPNVSRLSGGDPKKFIQQSSNVRKPKLKACGKNVIAPVDAFDLSATDFKTKDLEKFNSVSSKKDFNQDNIEELEDSLNLCDSEVLTCVKNIFLQESWCDSSVSCDHVPNDFHPLICANSNISERVDCHCNKPCDVPLSPSVVDATVDVRTLAEDGEILSSGDELDKIESDTDSQDTVIEGEAYKRMRSVAIKEKILHANEELLGTNYKQLCYSHDSCKFSNAEVSERNSNSRFDIEEITRKTLKSFFLEEHQNDIPKFLCSNLQENKTLETELSKEHHFPPFKKTDVSAFHPVLPSSFVEQKNNEFSDSRNLSSESSSYKTSFSENLCSSESSDNGSDGEEIMLSDTSTSSDEATYIAPSSGFRYYNQPLSYRLHTIVEESCEESERSSRGTTPTSRANSEFEYYDKAQMACSKNVKKVLRKPIADSSVLGYSKNGKSSSSYAVLATSRLEKYFKSGLLDGEVSYPEDDLTDESGGISSDDDISNVHLKAKLKNEFINVKLPVERQNKKSTGTVSDKSAVSLKTFSNALVDTSARKKYTAYADILKKTERRKNDVNNPSFSKMEPSTSNTKQTKNTEPSDEDAKYIMSHLMQHISNDTEEKTEIVPDVKDVSPMLKILESEIARLMLTVSPASLSAGEPSSSCSSTIGSNNSDYGSDTLESAEDTTSEEEITAEIVTENRTLGEHTPQKIPIADISEASATNVEESFNNTSQITDSTVSEETLYICKQLMASLKKIADATEGTVASDEFSANTEDHSAKQYITDQIVSLMQTVSASHNSPLLRTFTLNTSHAIHLDSDINQGRSDSDSPSPNGEKRSLPKSKTPSESGSETTISASISIPSYDDSDRTPTESEISHEMDELYALLENNGVHQDIISAKFSYELEAISQEKGECLRNIDSPISEGSNSSSDSCDMNSTLSESHSSLLSGAASKLESLLPITIEERIARYKKAFMTKTDEKESETRINVILPQPSKSNIKHIDDLSLCQDSDLSCFNTILKAGESCDIMPFNSNSSKNEEGYNITSVKIISHNTYPLSSAIHKILSSNIDSKYLEQKLDYQIVNILDASTENTSCDNNDKDEKSTLEEGNSELCEDSVSVPLPKVMNPKEKASSENDLLVANYRAKSKGSKVFGTKSVGNISELENTHSKSAFRDTGYYSFKSSEESFLSLDDSTASQTSTTSLTQYRSLTSTETIPEEEESCAKGTASAKMSLSSSNIPDAVCGTAASKSSTLPLSLRNKLSGTPGGNHRSRSSFFSTSGVLRKLTQLRDESGNSLRSSPHGRLRMRNRSLSGGSEDGKQRKSSVPQISVSECSENQIGRLSTASSEKDSSGIHEDEIDQAFAYHCRSQMSLSSFGGRSESVTSVYSAAGGGRYGTVTVTGEVLFGLIYNYKAGILEINVKECRNLAAVDTKRNRSDPYVKVYLLPDRTKSGKRKTKVKKHTLNPTFDECLKFHVTINELAIRTLWLSVWHSDRFGRNDFLGEVMLPLGTDIIESSCSKWYPLQERLETLDTPVSYKGDLILALKYVPPDVTSRKFSKKPGIPVKGALEVLVREARNLMATRSNGTSDPFCKSYLLPDKSKAGKQKTPVFKKSCNPKWNHTFIYDDVSLDDLRERCLELTIWDYDKITSNDFLGGVRLCLGSGKYQGRDVDWMDSVGEERSLWYTMIERPNTWVDGSLLLRPNMQSRRMV